MTEYVKAFKDGDKNKNNNLISLYIDGNKLLGKYKTIWLRLKI